MKHHGLLFVTLALGASAALAQTPSSTLPGPSAPEVIAPAGPPAYPVYPEPSPVLSRWDATLYGFVEFDAIHDNTESLAEIPGNPMLALPSTAAGTAGHGRTQFTVRNSRIGFRLGAPEYLGVKASGVLEMDFFGNQPSDASEGQFYTNPTFRIRHAYLKLETSVVDILLGQYWNLFGWQSIYQPATVEIQGVPGELYSRTTQIRISKTIRSEGFGLEFAIAALRPFQRDSQYPDGQGGVRFFLPGWMGWKTTGGAGSGIEPFGIGVTGVVRGFKVPSLNDASGKTLVATASGGFAIDALIPIVPMSSRSNHGNTLTFTGEYVNGSGITDLYTGFNGGVQQFPQAVPVGSGQSVTQYKAFANAGSFDRGNLYFDNAGNLQTVGWQSYILGLQYYFPGTGQFFVTGTYSNTWSGDSYKASTGPLYSNAYYTAKENSVFTRLEWYEVALWCDVTPAVRLASAYAYFKNDYADRSTQQNYRFQFSAWYIF